MRRLFCVLFSVLVCTFSFAQAPLVQSQWNGRTVAFMGDSITDAAQIGYWNDTYWNMLQDILGINAVSYGINARQMDDLVNQGERLLAERGEDFDAIVILLGTNDFNASLPMGEFFSYERKPVNRDGQMMELLHRTPVFDSGTFCGRLNIGIKWLKTTFPGKQIILLTPLHRGYACFSEDNVQPDENYANKQDLFIDDYVHAIVKAGEMWSVPVIDMFSISGLQPEIETQDFYFRNPERDLLHPNTAGHTRMAWTLAYQLCSLGLGW